MVSACIQPKDSSNPRAAFERGEEREREGGRGERGGGERGGRRERGERERAVFEWEGGREREREGGRRGNVCERVRGGGV